jgi:hypothetical protein
MERLFDHHGDFRAIGKFEPRRRIGRACRRQCQRTAIFGQIEAVLHDIVPERLARQGPVGQPGEERMGEDRLAQGGHFSPDRVAKSHHAFPC